MQVCSGHERLKIMIQLFMISYVIKTAEGTSFGGYSSIFTRPLKDFKLDNETNSGFDFHILSYEEYTDLGTG